HLATILDRIVAASERKTLMDTTRKSLLHWAGVFAQKTRQFYFLRMQVLGKQMWLKLIRTRTPGVSTEPLKDFSDEHLIELSVRQKQLRETERHLLAHLQEIERQKAEMNHYYEDFNMMRA